MSNAVSSLKRKISRYSLSTAPVFFYTRAPRRADARAHAQGAPRAPFGRLSSKRLAVTLTLAVITIVSLAPNVLRPAQTAAATSNTINFQARLETTAGAIVPDGNYNVQFKLYSASSGGSALWTESYLNSASQGVQVVNGYLTANLGSLTSFPGTINWDQQIWLTMNIGGTTTGAPSYDGEMSPRLALTALPYAFRAGQLADPANSGSQLNWITQTAPRTISLPNESGTLCIQASANCGFLTGSPGNYIQNGTSVQTANFNIQSAASGSIGAIIQGASGQTADLLQIKSSSALVANFTAAGALGIGGGPAANGVLTVGTNTTAATGGIYFGTDTNLYRLTTNSLKTDGALTVVGALTVNGQQNIIQPASNLTSGQTNVAQTFTNGSSSGGTVQGLSQTITVSNTSSASNTNGINITLTDGGTGGNVDKGLNVTMSGTNASRAEIGVSATVTRGLGLQGISSGIPGNSSGQCNAVGSLGVGVCGGDTGGSTAGAGVYGYSTSRDAGNIYDAVGSGVYGINQSGGGTAGTFLTGVKGIALQSSNAASTSIGVFGQATGGGASATAYGGYFTLGATSPTTLGAALYASNGTIGANILQLQDNTTDVLVVADGGNITAAGDLALNGGDLTTTQTTANLFATNATTVNVGTAATNALGGLNLAGGSGNTGCSINGTTGDLVCTGSISTLATTGIQGWWSRSGTTLQPATSGDAITTSGNLSTTGTGTLSVAGTSTLTGKVGIGVAPTASQLEVQGASGVTIGLSTTTNSASDSAYLQINNRARFGYSNGNVIIDDNSTSKGLQVNLNGGTALQLAATTSAATFKNASDSTAGFQIQRAGAGGNLFTVDTQNSRLSIGSASPANSLLTIGTNTTAASGGVTFGTDTNLYRSSVATLNTDSALTVVGNLTVNGTVSGTASGSGVAGGTGSGTTGDDGGGGGGAIGGVNAAANANPNFGADGAQSVDISGLFSVLSGLSVPTVSPGAGNDNGSGACAKPGGNASGFGTGGGGAGYFGGNGGNGLYGGGGGGAAGDGCIQTGGTGGNGVVVISPTGGTNVLLNSGTSYTVPAGVTTLKIWVVGAGGGGAGATIADSSSGGGGGAGGVVYRTFGVVPGSSVSYSLGTGGTGGTNSANGSAGGNTTATVAGATLIASGGSGGQFNNSVVGAGGAAYGGDTLDLVGNIYSTSNSVVFQNTSNSTAAFQVQNSSGTQILGVDTSNNRVTLGQSSALNGALTFNNSTNSNTITLQASAATSSYTLLLPTSNGATNQCLQMSGVANQLAFGACGTSTGLAKNAIDSSAFAVTAGSNLYTFTNGSSAVASGVLKVDNGSNTSSALTVTASGVAASGQALILVTNTTNTLTGNLIDLQAGSSPVSKFSVSSAGNADLEGNGGATLTVGKGTSTSGATSTLQIQGARTAANIFGQLDFTNYNQTTFTNDVQARVAARQDGTNSAALEFYTAKSDVLGTNPVLRLDSNNSAAFRGNVEVGVRGGNRLFSDAFESGNLALWDQGTGGTITTQTSIVHDGKYAAQTNFSAGSGYASATITNSTTAYARAWVYVGSQTSSNVGFLNLQDATGKSFTVGRFSATGNVNFWNEYTGVTTDSGVAMATAGWHMIEMRITTSATTGISQVWLDGTLITSLTSQNNGSSQLHTVKIGDSTGGRTMNIYYDDLAADIVTTGTQASLNVDDSFHVGGTSSFGDSVLLQSASNNVNALQIQNSSGNTMLAFDTTAPDGHLAIGDVGSTGTAHTDKLEVVRTDSTTENGLRFTNLGGADWKLFQATGTDDLAFSSDNFGSFAQNVFTLGVSNGSALFHNYTDSTTAFQIQASSGASNLPLFTADTSGKKIQIGSATTDANAVLLILDSYNNATDPTGTNGGMYYNTSTNKFRCYQNSTWRDCISPWIQITKSADQDVTNSATLVSDSALQFPVTAGVTYTVRFNICYAGNSTAGDYKGQFTFPAAIALKNINGRYDTTAIGDGVQSSAGILATATTSWPATNTMGTAAALTDKRIFEGAFTFQPNSSGTMNYQFAQAIATAATSARTCANSFIEYQAL